MRELKILAVLIFFTLVTYYGVEPFSHKEMHAHVEPANFDVEKEDSSLIDTKIKAKKAEVEKLSKVSPIDNKALEFAKKELEDANNELIAYEDFWAAVGGIVSIQGDAAAGAETFSMSCVACHGLKSQGIESPFDSSSSSEAFGVVVPDLSDAGAIYDKKFLAGLIINPVYALKLAHKFDDDKPFPMTPFVGVNEDFNQDAADIIAYLQSISTSEISGKEIFESACLRCHDMKYDKLYVTSDREPLAKYMGSNPPDLSMMIRSRGAEYLKTFINDPQKNIPGTAMPRVGLNEKSQEKLINYMEQIGDSKKDERTVIGLFMIGFFAIMTILAYLWKREVWRDLH